MKVTRTSKTTIELANKSNGRIELAVTGKRADPRIHAEIYDATTGRLLREYVPGPASLRRLSAITDPFVD